jgi:hypothetical protein
MTSCNHKRIEKEWFVSNIEKHGLAIIMVESSKYSPSFAYSIGLLQTYNHPEIICFGLSTKLLHTLINDVAEIIKTGENIQIDKTYTNIFKDSRAEFLKIDNRNIKDYFSYAIEYFETENFPALQLIWTDRKDRFPWEQDYEEEFKYNQPLLDRNFDFKFRESKNLAVFTTKQWLDNNEPILRVVHDCDGDWQFLTGDPIEGDGKVVGLGTMTNSDKTLNEIFDLEYGEKAERTFVGGHWTRNKMEENVDE